MDQGHLHLIMTHLPIFGAFLGCIVLLEGIWVKSDQVKLAGYSLLIIAAIGAIISYVTGEAAEELVEGIPGIAETMVEEHEEFAMFALVALIAAGVFSLIGCYLHWKNMTWKSNMAVITLMVCVVSFALVGWTGYLGGKIRHTELFVTVNTGQEQLQTEEGDDD